MPTPPPRRPAPRVPTDAQLVAALRADTHGAVEVLHARYAPALLAYARSLLGGSHHDAEECVQDAFVRALRALKATPGREMALRAWLYTITRNACVDRLRARAARAAVNLDDVAPALAGRGDDPHAALMRRESLTAVVVGLRGLPDRQRAALVGHELEGRSHGELAAGLGMSEGASKALVHRARAGLQAALAV